MIQRKSPFSADRQHLHYILRDAGFSVAQVVGVMALLSVALSLFALFADAHGVPEAAMFAAFIVLLLGYLALMANAGAVTRLAGRLRRSSEKAPDSVA